MSIPRFRRPALAVAASFAAVTAAATFAPPASAQAPSGWDQLTVDFTRTVDFCGFPVLAHSEGTLVARYYNDENGVLVREVDSVRRSYTITYTNEANGKSVSTKLGGPVFFEFAADGSYTYSIIGRERIFLATGTGPVASEVGRITIHVAADGTQTTTFEAGRWEDINAGVCAYLA